MAKSEWAELVEQLQDPDPKTRRQIYRKMAATRDPAVLPYLRTAYLQEEDDRARQIVTDALASFKAMQTGETRRQLPLGENTLRRILAGLAVLFVVSLLLNGAVIVAGLVGGDDDEQPAANTGLTDREALTAQLSERLAQAHDDTDNLRTEVSNHNDTGQITCAVTYHRPQQITISDLDRQTHRDLAVVSDRLGLALLQLQQPQSLWDFICQTKTPSMSQGLEALRQLDMVTAELDKVDKLLQQAVLNPVVTIAPTATPLPTPTLTPEPDQPTATDLPPATGEPAEPTGTDAPTATPTIPPEESSTPLPYPELDYTEVLRALSSQFVIMGDLQNNLGTGLIDNWQKVQNGGTISTSFCTLQAWPEPFAWTEEQQAELDRPTVADPELEEAVQLIAEAVDLANQARALYEPSCSAGTLTETASQGTGLASDALEKFTQAQQIIETIRRRTQ